MKQQPAGNNMPVSQGGGERGGDSVMREEGGIRRDKVGMAHAREDLGCHGSSVLDWRGSDDQLYTDRTLLY